MGLSLPLSPPPGDPDRPIQDRIAYDGSQVPHSDLETKPCLTLATRIAHSLKAHFAIVNSPYALHEGTHSAASIPVFSFAYTAVAIVKYVFALSGCLRVMGAPTVHMRHANDRYFRTELVPHLSMRVNANRVNERSDSRPEAVSRTTHFRSHPAIRGQ